MRNTARITHGDEQLHILDFSTTSDMSYLNSKLRGYFVNKNGAIFFAKKRQVVRPIFRPAFSKVDTTHTMIARITINSATKKQTKKASGRLGIRILAATDLSSKNR